MSWLNRWFVSHPKSVGETYLEHASVAARFGGIMIVGGIACLIHAFFPALFPHAASDRVKRLYLRMKSRQPAFADQPPAFSNPAWQLEYEI